MKPMSADELFILAEIDSLLSEGKQTKANEAYNLIVYKIQHGNNSPQMLYDLQGRVGWASALKGDYAGAQRAVAVFQRNHLARKCWGVLMATHSEKSDSLEKRTACYIRFLRTFLVEMNNLQIGKSFAGDESATAFIKGSIWNLQNRLSGFAGLNRTLLLFS